MITAIATDLEGIKHFNQHPAEVEVQHELPVTGNDGISLKNLKHTRQRPEYESTQNYTPGEFSDQSSNSSGNINVYSNTDGLTADNIEFPDGGLKAWLTVMGSFLGLTASFGIFNSTSAIETYIANNQLENVSASVVGWVFSIYMAMSLLCGIFTGDLFDMKGPRIPIFLGGSLVFLGVFTTASCTKVYQFILALGLVCGLGIGFQVSSLIGIISHWFDKKRGMATGIATVGGSVGGAIFPIILKKLYSSLGFPWAMRVLAFILAFFEILALVLVVPRFPPKKFHHDKKIPLYKRTIKFLKNTVDLKGLKDPRFAYCTLGVCLSETFLSCSLTYYGSYALAKGNSESTSYLLITILNAMGIFARVAAGYLSDKIGKFNMMTIMVFFSSLFCLIIWLPFGHTTGGLYAFSVIYGISSAGVLSLIPLCLSQISRVEDFGKRYSTAYLAAAFGCLIGVPISGLFIGSHPTSRNYDNYIIFISALGFASVCSWVLSRMYAVKLRLCVY
ncbi:hypothetical protein DASC09_037460 [Saccharomycopsis crataegensis]|uniref:Major facilitator superfamily (MFS) profile domain-containing protein n=1 Tax=Saccharomycopsis crataegensis TaxID=43959 RepID=A0AAV5QPC8_9ASCO|nr:hypothetical protein DASC09_037460 [Saccharomycopsis crataegensis]